MSQIPKLFELNTIIVNEKVGVLKIANQYKLQNEKGEDVGAVHEKVPGWSFALRMVLNKSMLPFELNITDEQNQVLASIKRGFTLFMSKVKVFDGSGKLIGTFQGKFKLLGTRFDIEDENGARVGTIEGNWKGWDFKISDKDGNQIGSVNKKWAGALKEVFTTADKYKVEISEKVSEDENKILIVAVAITIDMILKESS